MKEQQGRRPGTGKAIVPVLSVFAQFSSVQILASPLSQAVNAPGAPHRVKGKRGMGE